MDIKRLIAYSLLLIAFSLSGCIIRMSSYDVDRVDQDVKGNRGIVRGGLSSAPEAKEIKKTKRMYNIEIELPSSTDTRDVEKEDAKSEVGNRGYVRLEKINETQYPAAKEQKKTIRLKGPGIGGAPQVVYQSPAAVDKKYQKEKGAGTIVEKEVSGGPKTYVVQKGDTLQKISDKIYGTTKQWKTIYEANKDTLKSPDLIKPGQELVIP